MLPVLIYLIAVLIIIAGIFFCLGEYHVIKSIERKFNEYFKDHDVISQGLVDFILNNIKDEI